MQYHDGASPSSPWSSTARPPTQSTWRLASRLTSIVLGTIRVARGFARDVNVNRTAGPMTLGNMRQNGVRGLDVTCLHCRHHTEVNVDAHPDDVPVPSFAP